MSIITNDLMNDHQSLFSVLDAFSRFLDQHNEHHLPDLDEADLFLQFLAEFADEYHQGKEEVVLFPALMANGIADRGGPIGVMMAEHIQCRGYLYKMVEALDDPINWGEFEKAGRNYIRLLRLHIHKEDSIVFPLADQVLSDEALESLNKKILEHVSFVTTPAQLKKFGDYLVRITEKFPE